MASPGSASTLASLARHPARLLGWSLALVNLFVAGMAYMALHESRDQYRDRARFSADNLSRLIEQSLGARFAVIDQALNAVVDEAERELELGKLQTGALEACLRRHQARVRGLDAMRFADAEGAIVLGTAVVPGSRVSIADRDYFQRLREDAAAGLVLSRPARGRISGKWVIMLARGIRARSGQFRGVVYAVLTLDEVARFFSSLELGPHGAVALRNLEMRVLARFPDPVGPASYVDSVSVSAAMRQAILSGQHAGSLDDNVGPDGLQRTVSFHTIEGYPLFVAVGLSPVDYLTPWRQEAWRTWALAGLCGLLTLVFLRIAGRGLRLQQRHAEELLAGQQLMRGVFESAGVGITIADRHGRFLQTNRKWAEFLGYTPEDVIGLTNHEVTHPGDWAESSRNMADLLAGKVDSYVQEKRYLHKDGRIRWGLLSVSPILGDQGEIKTLIGIVADLTVRKQMETELFVAKERLSIATQGAGIGIWDLDLASGTEVWDDASLSIYGLSREAFGGTYQDWIHCLHPEDRGLALEAQREAFEGRRDYAPEFRIVRPDGSIRHLKAAARILRDAEGRPQRMVGINLDITARKLAEEKVRQSVVRLQTILANLHSGVLVVGSDGRIENVNPFFCDLLGIPGRPEDLIGMDRETFFGILRPCLPDPEAYIQRTREIVQAGVATHDELVLAHNGRTHLRDYLPIVVDGVVTGRIWAQRDITELKAAEQELLDHRKALEALNLDLKERTSQAEAANRAKSEFLANMSHEIRTPMNGILGLSHLALRTELTAKQHTYLEGIQNASRLLMGVLNDILDLSKIEAGKLDLECRAFDLGKVFGQVDAVMAPRAREKGLTLAFELPSDVPRLVMGDELRLGQVLINLASNAVKFTDQGHVSVAAAVAERGPGRLVLGFSVEDTGPGIEAEVLSRLFQPFSQADSSTTRKFGGTGLGLAIVKRLVALIGGTLAVSSEPGRGSVFGFTIPLLLQETGPAPSATEFATGPEEAAPGHGRILLVEDDEVNLLIATEIMEAAGFQVEAARNGQEAVALALASGAAYDLILMDIQMPVVDGLEATAELRRGGVTLPIIAMTAHAMAAEQQACLDAGMDGHLTKPFEAAELLAVLGRWCRPGPGRRPTAEAILVRLAGTDAPRTRRLNDALREDLKLNLGALREAVQRDDAPAASRLAHTLKGLSVLAEATGVREGARELEQRLLSLGPWTASALALERLLVSALEALPQRLPSEEPAGLATAPDPGQLRDCLHALHERLRRKSLSARKDLAVLRGLLSGEPRVLRLEGALGRMDFKKAQEGLEQLSRELGIPLP